MTPRSGSSSATSPLNAGEGVGSRGVAAEDGQEPAGEHRLTHGRSRGPGHVQPRAGTLGVSNSLSPGSTMDRSPRPVAADAARARHPRHARGDAGQSRSDHDRGAETEDEMPLNKDDMSARLDVTMQVSSRRRRYPS